MRIPPSVAAGGISEDEQEELRPTGILPATRDTAAVVAYLRGLACRCDGPVPLISELRGDQLRTPAATASIARAALCWLAEGTDDAIRLRLVDELEVADLLARWRVRQAGHDIRVAVEDWSRVYDIMQARTGGASARRIAESMAAP